MNKEKLNELLTFILENITESSRKIALAFIKEFIIPGLCKGDKEIKEEESEQAILSFSPIQPEQGTKKPVKKAKSLNGHKIEKKRKLNDREKNIIRSEFLRLNGIIYEDACLEIKKKLGNDISIFQVTGFITLLHRYVKKGQLSLRDMDSYSIALEKRRQSIPLKKRMRTKLTWIALENILQEMKKRDLLYGREWTIREEAMVFIVTHWTHWKEYYPFAKTTMINTFTKDAKVLEIRIIDNQTMSDKKRAEEIQKYTNRFQTALQEMNYEY